MATRIVSGSCPHASTPGEVVIAIDAAMGALEIARGFARGGLRGLRVDEPAGRDQAISHAVGYARDVAGAREPRHVVRILASRLERARGDRGLERALDIAIRRDGRSRRGHDCVADAAR